MGNVLIIGSLNYDIAISAKHLPSVGETVIGKNIYYNCGGKGANQACACALAGSRTAILGAVGGDAWAEKLEGSLRAADVDTRHLLRFADAGSGVAVVTVDDAGKNAIIVIPGANYLLTPAHIEARRARIEDADAVLLQLEIPLLSVYRALELARDAGKTVILNPAPAQRIDDVHLAMIDYLVPNETELAQLAPGEDSLEDKARRLLASGVKNVVVTLGEAGALYLNERGEISRYPSRPVRAIDTVGAGDCFCGYFSSAVAAGIPAPEAIREAIAAASISVTRPGAQGSFPTKNEVLKLKEEDFSHV